jgi:aryl-alcohol dehydrogenase-like predicted oxidoreductase
MRGEHWGLRAHGSSNVTTAGLRRLALTDVQLSELTFGSMRMHERHLSEEHWQRLLTASLECGVSTCHSSSEYESFPLFCATLGRLDAKARRLQHIVKLADPHFGESAFEPGRLRARVDGYLSQLNAERLDVVQWMWRADLKDERSRIAGLEEQSGTIAATFAALKREGKIGAVVPFAYTDDFAERVIAMNWCDGLTVYLGPVETEARKFVDQARLLKRSIIALRPLAAGRAAEGGWTTRRALCWTLDHEPVVTGVISYSSEEHLAQLLEPES